MAWLNYLVIAFGGALGAVARYQVSVFGQLYWPGHFPWSTFLVNIAGSFFFGCLYVIIVEKGMFSEPVRLLVLVGFLGAFTTFSTFSFELMNLVKSGDFVLAITYGFASVILSFIAVITAYQFTRFLVT